MRIRKQGGCCWRALDFLKKPFVPDILVLRVRHMIDFDRLQRKLSEEVDKKTEERKHCVP